MAEEERASDKGRYANLADWLATARHAPRAAVRRVSVPTAGEFTKAARAEKLPGLVARAYFDLHGLLLRLARHAPLQALAVVYRLRSDLDRWATEVVTEARQQGVSWAVIGSAVGITRQAAQKRFGPQIGEQNQGAD